MGLWKELGVEIKRRFKKPFGFPAFVLYFLGIIILVGGLGVWIPLYKQDWQAVPRDLSNYLLAILSASAADLTIFETDKRSLQMVAFVSLFVGIALAVLALTNSDLTRAYIYAVSGAALALFLWWIANSDNIRLTEKNNSPDVVTGGDPHTNPAGTMGEIES